MVRKWYYERAGWPDPAGTVCAKSSLKVQNFGTLSNEQIHDRQCQPTSCGTSTEHYPLPVSLTQHGQWPAINAAFILAPCRLGGRMVSAPTDATSHAAPMTCPKWWVAA
jgi:hypothetical protein